MIVWFTGQPHSGKSTLARKLIEYFTLQKKTSIQIDGDKLREMLNYHDYSLEGRMFAIEMAQTIADLAEKKNSIDYTVVSLVSPFRNQRERFKKTNNVVEVYLTSTRFRDGKMVSYYEPPQINFLHIDTDQYDIDQSIYKIISYITNNNISDN